MKNVTVAGISVVVFSLAGAGLFGARPTSAGPVQTCLSSARAIPGERARNLIQALIFAGIRRASHTGDHGSWLDVYSVDSLRCQENPSHEDGIPRFGCDSPRLEGGEDAKAKVLFDAIEGLGIAPDAGFGLLSTNAENVSCAVSVIRVAEPSSASTPPNGQVGYSCNVTAVWSDQCR